MDTELNKFIQKIESAATRDEQIEALENYVNFFDKWLENNQSSKTKEELTEVLDIHQELIHHAGLWLKSEAEEFKAHKAKAKAIMAYADTLPKKISWYKPTKG
jgi:hypothetical protein